MVTPVAGGGRIGPGSRRHTFVVAYVLQYSEDYRIDLEASRRAAPINCRFRFECRLLAFSARRAGWKPCPLMTLSGHGADMPKSTRNGPLRTSFDLYQQEQFVVRRECGVVVAATDAQRSAAHGIT